MTRPVLGQQRTAIRLIEPGLDAAPRPSAASPAPRMDAMDEARRTSLPAIDVAEEHALATRVTELEARLGALVFWSRESKAALRSILASSAWRDGSLSERTQILRVLEALPTTPTDDSLYSYGHGTPFQTPVEAFARLTGKLTQRAADGTTLIAQLERLATHPFAPAVAGCFAHQTPSIALASVVQEVADPARIEQATAATCTVTSLAYALAQRDPAEYARLNVSLLLDAEVHTRGGERLVFDRNGTETSIAKPSERSISERAFQSALMQAAFPRADYVFTDTSTAPEGREAYETNVLTVLPLWLRVLSWIFFPAGIILSLIRFRQTGLSDDNLAAITTSVLGREYHSVAASLDALRGHLDSNGRVRAPVFVSFDHFAGGPHELSLVGVEGEGEDAVLICRNPWGSIWVDVDGEDLATTYALLWKQKPGVRPATDSLKGVRFEDSSEGTIRIPLGSATGRTIRGFVLPN